MPGTGGVNPDWLTLREPADATARDADLAELAGRALPAGRGAVIHDLGCGTGSMLRWLAPRLSVPQHWRLGAGQGELAAAWCSGWFGAACEQRPELSGAADYAQDRLAQARAGPLSVTVHHVDLLARPR